MDPEAPKPARGPVDVRRSKIIGRVIIFIFAVLLAIQVIPMLLHGAPHNTP